jgi:hypothetical protein
MPLEPPPLSRPEPDLIDVLSFLWRSWRSLAVGLAAGAALGGLFLLLAVPHYRVSIIVGPAVDLSGSGLVTRGEGFESAATAGLSARMGTGESPDFVRFEKTLTGTAVATTLFQDPKIPEGVSRAARFSFLPGPHADTPEALSAILSRSVSIEPVGLTPLRKIVYSHPDPAFALFLAGALHRTADARIRVDAKIRSAKRIAFLESRMARVRHPDQLRALAALLTEQEQISMMAAMDEPYAAAVVEPPAASPRPTWPPRALVLAVFMAAGTMAGAMAAGVRHLRIRRGR